MNPAEGAVARLSLPQAVRPGETVRVDLSADERPLIVTQPDGARAIVFVMPGDRVVFMSRVVDLPWYRRLWLRLWRKPIPFEWRMLMGAGR